jgi:hypothetical protein
LSNNRGKRSLNFLLLIGRAQPVAQPLSALLKIFVQLRPLFWR